MVLPRPKPSLGLPLHSTLTHAAPCERGIESEGCARLLSNHLEVGLQAYGTADKVFVRPAQHGPQVCQRLPNDCRAPKRNMGAPELLW